MVKIYAIKNPLNGDIIYVGASVRPKQRFSVHQNGSEWHPITYRYKQVMLLKAANVKPELIILGEAEREKAKELEQYWIDYYISIGHKLSQLKTSTYPRNEYQNYIMKYKLQKSKPESTSHSHPLQE